MRIGDQHDNQQQCIQCRFVEERRLMPLPEFLYVNTIRKELEIWICDQISVSLLIHKIPPTPDGLSKNKAGNQRICKRPEGKLFDLAVNQYNSNTAEDASINGKPALIDLKNGEKVILVLLPLKKHIVCSGTENTHGNHPIYGYLKDPEDYHKLVINPETAPIVQDIFQWYVYEGMNKNAIARKLIALGIPSPTAYKQQMGMNYHNPHAQTGKVYWSERTIVNMLKNPTYLGHMVQGRHQVKSYKVHTIVPIPEDDWFWVENTHEAIIDQQTFDRAQELLEKNVRTSPKAKTVYLFSGFLRCGDCGRGMTRRTSKGYTYYSCKTYIMKSRGLCSSHTIRDELVEQVVFEAVKRQIDLCGSLAEIIDEISQAPVVRNQSTRLDKLLKTQEQELHKITNLCDNLYIDWKSGDLTRDEYHRMKAKFEQQAEEIRQTIANLQEEQTFVSNGITSADPYLQTFLKYKNIDHLERGIVVALIKQISIYEEKRIEVEFNFADQHQRILDFIEANQPKLRVVKSEAV